MGAGARTSMGLLSKTETAPPVPPERKVTQLGADLESYPHAAQTCCLLWANVAKRTAVEEACRSAVGSAPTYKPERPCSRTTVISVVVLPTPCAHIVWVCHAVGTGAR